MFCRIPKGLQNAFKIKQRCIISLLFLSKHRNRSKDSHGRWYSRGVRVYGGRHFVQLRIRRVWFRDLSSSWSIRYIDDDLHFFRAYVVLPCVHRRGYASFGYRINMNRYHGEHSAHFEEFLFQTRNKCQANSTENPT